ncbi:MAG: beta-hydroxyacyl-ACP dehydratase [Pricia sp.]|nr:beta-hydroxyacyl-ACP dehydratase [Pricia sp.]
MDYSDILAQLPYSEPFLFVDTLEKVDGSGVVGSYTFPLESSFYNGHFKGNPVTPGVLLTECCAQIGVVCLGIFLLKETNEREFLTPAIGMSSTEMEFLKPVFPDEKVTVTSKKIYFRFQKLKCEVKMHNSSGELVCKGIIAGMLKSENHG